MLTKYVTTRYYRAPELYLQYEENYTTALDMWSIGCIIAELFNKKVFMRAKTPEDFLENLVELLGMPPENIKKNIKEEKFLAYMQDHSNKTPRKSFEELLPDAPPEAIDLIKKLMSYDPKERLTAR